MKINKEKLRMGLWFEDKDGNYIPYDDSKGVDYVPENAATFHVSFPLEIHERIYKINDDGTKTHVLTGSTNIGGDGSGILAIANSGDYTLKEAIALYVNTCERCANALLWKYTNGADGYPEDSDEYRNCNTRCEYCKEECDE